MGETRGMTKLRWVSLLLFPNFDRFEGNSLTGSIRMVNMSLRVGSFLSTCMNFPMDAFPNEVP